MAGLEQSRALMALWLGLLVLGGGVGARRPGISEHPGRATGPGADAPSPAATLAPQTDGRASQLFQRLTTLSRSTAPAPSPAQSRHSGGALPPSSSQPPLVYITAAETLDVVYANSQVSISAAPAPGPSIANATNSVDLDTAVGVILRIAGTGVTPFGPANQERLIQVLAYGAGNISSSAFHVVLVADAYSSRRRALLSWPWESLTVQSSGGTPLANVADVSVEIKADSSSSAVSILGQMSALLHDYTAMSYAQNSQGVLSWGITLLAIGLSEPTNTTATLPCQSQFGMFCLDGTVWTYPLVTLVICCGSILVFLTIIFVFVYIETRRASGKTGVLEYPKEDSMTTMDRVKHFLKRKDGAAPGTPPKPPQAPPPSRNAFERKR